MIFWSLVIPAVSFTCIQLDTFPYVHTFPLAEFICFIFVQSYKSTGLYLHTYYLPIHMYEGPPRALLSQPDRHVHLHFSVSLFSSWSAVETELNKQTLLLVQQKFVWEKVKIKPILKQQVRMKPNIEVCLQAWLDHQLLHIPSFKFWEALYYRDLDVWGYV